MGFLACVTLIPKILLQDIWRYGRDDGEADKWKIGWDDRLPENLLKRMYAFAGELNVLQALRVVRSLRPLDFDPALTTYQLHTFCDNSTRGYGAVVYLRAQCGSSTSVNLVTARAKVAPVQQQTIPRLELMGAILGYRLEVRTRRTLKVNIVSGTWWTDSSTVLYWLRTEATLYSAFVANRKEEIRETSR